MRMTASARQVEGLTNTTTSRTQTSQLTSLRLYLLFRHRPVRFTLPSSLNFRIPTSLCIAAIHTRRPLLCASHHIETVALLIIRTSLGVERKRLGKARATFFLADFPCQLLPDEPLGCSWHRACGRWRWRWAATFVCTMHTHHAKAQACYDITMTRPGDGACGAKVLGSLLLQMNSVCKIFTCSVHHFANSSIQY
jgi:hypothetical protein